MLDAWIRINADGTATVFTGKVELGQGILTALAQIAAEELDLPLARVAMISGDTGRTPNEGVTSGSQSIENSGTALRLAAAEVRAILIEQAPREARSRARTSLKRRRRRHQRGERQEGQLWRACRVARPEARGDRERAAEAGRRAQDRRPVDRALRHSRQGHRQGDLRAGPAPARHGAWPRGASAELRRDARLGGRRQGEGDQGRDRGGARRLVPRRRRRARGAGRQGARRARRGRAMEAGPGPARSGAAVRASEGAAHQGADDQRQAGAAAGERAESRSRRPTPSPTWRTPRSAPRPRSRNSRTTSTRSGPIRRACSRCAANW